MQVAPQLVFTAPAWDDELLTNLPDDRVSVENAVTLVGDTAYFTTSGGLLQGWDLSSLRTGQGVSPGRSASGPATTPTPRSWPTRRATSTSARSGTAATTAVARSASSSSSTPAVRTTRWSGRSPSSRREERHVVDTGALRGPRHLAHLHRAGVRHRPGHRRHPLDHRAPVRRHELAGRRRRHPRPGRRPGRPPRLRPHRRGGQPTERWTVQLPANVESTPALWKGRIYVGTRDGFMYATADA